MKNEIKNCDTCKYRKKTSENRPCKICIEEDNFSKWEFDTEEESEGIGHWISTGTMSFFNYHSIVLCSKCNYETNKRTNYCPNCGAFMKNEVPDNIPLIAELEEIKEEIEKWYKLPHSNLSKMQYEILTETIIGERIKKLKGENE